MQQQQPVQQTEAQPQQEVDFPPPPEKPVKPRTFNRQEAYEDSSSESARYLDEVDDWRDKIDEYNSLKNQYDNALVREKMEAMEEEKAQAQRVRDAQRQQASQLKEVDHEGSVSRVAEKLRIIYSKAIEEKVFLVEDLKATMQTASMTNQLELAATQTKFINDAMAGVPMHIYIG